MAAIVKQICALSIMCGAAMSLSPEGNVKKIMNVLCSLALISCLVFGIKDMDFKVYSTEIAKYKDREAEFIKNSEAAYESMNKSVIQQQYTAYILDKATELGLVYSEMKLTVQWNTDGFWVPYLFEINCEYNAELAEYIETELGIPTQRQYWKNNE